ncbi:MAG: hypothetical protein ABI778_10970, partial [Ignavibacteriota bacterium]
MNQREKISNNFSDAYLTAMLEGIDTSEVFREYSKDFPEMVSAFVADSRSLDILYGDMRTSEMPSDEVISAAYQKVSMRFAASPSVAPSASEVKDGLFAKIKTVFS